jgi:POT family proton-dependent oligopeptide transporter
MVDHSGDPERKNPAYLGESNNAAPAYLHHEGKATMQDSYLSDSASESNSFPTEEEMLTLKRVPAPIPWRIYTIAFVELVERMSYYGCVQVYSNFIAKKRPTPTGMALHPNDANAQPGALGMGKQIAFSLTTFNSFWVYVTPFLGAWIADTYLGRFNTIHRCRHRRNRPCDPHCFCCPLRPRQAKHGPRHLRPRHHRHGSGNGHVQAQHLAPDC